MAALTTVSNTEITDSLLKELYESIQVQLPAYAQPIFLRLLHEAKLTSTFKQIKGSLVKESFNPELSADDLLFWLNRSGKTYEKVTTEVHDMIVSGKIRL